MPVRNTPAGTLTADRRLYLNREGKVVEADSPDKAELLAAEGTTIAPDDATRLGLTDKDGRLAYEGDAGPKKQAAAKATADADAADDAEVQRRSEKQESKPAPAPAPRK